TTSLKASRFSWRASTSRLRRIGMPARTRVASCRVNTATPFSLIGRPKERRRFRAGPAPAESARVARDGGLAGMVAGAARGEAGRTESLAIGIYDLRITNYARPNRRRRILT